MSQDSQFTSDVREQICIALDHYSHDSYRIGLHGDSVRLLNNQYALADPDVLDQLTSDLATYITNRRNERIH